MRAVNLLPRETRSHRGSRRLDPVVVGGAVLTVAVAAAIGGGFAVAHSHATSEQQKLATVRAELQQLQAQERKGSGTKEPSIPVPTVTQQQVPWQAAFTSALSTRFAWDDVLFQLAHVVPPRVTVTNVTLGSATTTGPATGADSLSLGGTAFNESDVAQLLSRLTLVPSLSQITLSSSTADPKTGVVTFAVTAQVGAAATSTPPAQAAGAAS